MKLDEWVVGNSRLTDPDTGAVHASNFICESREHGLGAPPRCRGRSNPYQYLLSRLHYPLFDCLC